MTKPNRKARRADEWIFDMPAGRVTHVPTGLQFRLLIIGAEVPGNLTVHGVCRLPEGIQDVRAADRLAPDDANAPGVTQWAVAAPAGALAAARKTLAVTHGPGQAEQMVAAIVRDAGERWIFRARLERGWPDGRRAT